MKIQHQKEILLALENMVADFSGKKKTTKGSQEASIYGALLIISKVKGEHIDENARLQEMWR